MSKSVKMGLKKHSFRISSSIPDADGPVRIPTENLIENIPVYVPLCPECPQCEPYSEEACIMAFLSNGFQIATMKKTGYNWKGPWAHKGCYVYTKTSFKGFGFYGTGGTAEQMQLPHPAGDAIRPKGYDCN